MILAAGLGTRLRPWTLEHPKALVPVAGVPMLERVIVSLRSQGFDYIVINVHHFASQIIEYLASKDFGIRIVVSDESGKLLDTGGGILHAKELLAIDPSPFLVHNVDILSSANLNELMQSHREDNLATLLVSERDSSRRLIFDKTLDLLAWHNIKEDIYKPSNFKYSSDFKSYAFSGIYVLSIDALNLMTDERYPEKFPIMDFFLDNVGSKRIKGYCDDTLRLIDIGKPETLSRANDLLISANQI